MGTNYYLLVDACAHCGRSDEELHVGKSSGGWTFALHVIPERGLNNLEDWLALLQAPENNVVYDEYGGFVDRQRLLTVITERRGNNDFTKPYNGFGYQSWEDFHARNYSEPGPFGLVRSRVDGVYCIGHSAGTWDLKTGEFS